MTTQTKVGSALSRGFQFRLGTLLLAILWVALICMGLRSGSEPWSGIIFILAMGSLLVAALTSIYRTGRTRAFALGFLIFGATYMFLASGEHGYDDPSAAQPDLMTTRWAISLYSLLHADGIQTTAQTIVTPLSAPYPTAPVIAPATSYVTSERVVVLPGSPMALPPAAMPPPPTAGGPQPMRVITRTVRTQAVSLAAFLGVAHNSLLVLLGIIGGITAQVLQATRKDGC